MNPDQVGRSLLLLLLHRLRLNDYAILLYPKKLVGSKGESRKESSSEDVLKRNLALGSSPVFGGKESAVAAVTIHGFWEELFGRLIACCVS